MLAIHSFINKTMSPYGKTSRAALAAVSYLSKFHKDGIYVGSKQISEAVNIPKPLIAKVLTTVSQANLIKGTRGPNGGYILARPPAEIYINEIYGLFGKGVDNDDLCPMGPGWCGVKDPCPLHETLVQLRAAEHEALCNVTLERFSYKS